MNEPMEEPTPNTDEVDLYPPLETIDFMKIYRTFTDTALFDDVYLGMQGMNIALVDQVVTDLEHSLLHRFIEIERTPTQDVMFVSALSQMWVFGVYELLRTWRGRVATLLKWKDTGGLKQFILNQEKEEQTAARGIRIKHAEHLMQHAEFADTLRQHLAAYNEAFAIADAIRINLAKHELPGKKNSIPFAPGYGRINMVCGAMDYFIHQRDEAFTILNRRDLAESLRGVTLQTDSTTAIS